MLKGWQIVNLMKLSAEGLSHRRIAEITGVSRNTARKYLLNPQVQKIKRKPRESKLDPYKSILKRSVTLDGISNCRALLRKIRALGYKGGYSILRVFVQDFRPSRQPISINKWMQQVSNNILSKSEIISKIGKLKEIDKLLLYLRDGALYERKKAMAILFHHAGIRNSNIYHFLGLAKGTCLKYISQFNTSGAEALFKRRKKVKKIENEVLREKVFTVLHQPPKSFGFIRTSWTIIDLKSVLDTNDCPISRGIISAIIKSAGYSWKKAKIVLTSPDPNYRQKLEHIKSILSNLQRDEAFFSIDEYGPFAVIKRGGLSLVPPNQQKTVPQWQKSKGRLIITAALDLSTNNVTHFYSENKNTDEMIKLMDVLLSKYNNYKKIYLSWDAASWHVSYKLFKHIEENNVKVPVAGGCVVEPAPLPSSAQFLNVIESVFSGMARAIIHNSDYQSVKEAKAAIDRYFEERNNHFKENPKRAGCKIWGKERTLSQFSETNNCKDPRYR